MLSWRRRTTTAPCFIEYVRSLIKPVYFLVKAKGTGTTEDLVVPVPFMLALLIGCLELCIDTINQQNALFHGAGCLRGQGGINGSLHMSMPAQMR